MHNEAFTANLQFPLPFDYKSDVIQKNQLLSSSLLMHQHAFCSELTSNTEWLWLGVHLPVITWIKMRNKIQQVSYAQAATYMVWQKFRICLMINLSENLLESNYIVCVYTLNKNKSNKYYILDAHIKQFYF